MPMYTVEQLVALKESDLVTVPEFVWNKIDKVPTGTHFYENQANTGSSWRRGSHSNQKRPVVMPKAAIPFSQRALFSKQTENEEDDRNDQSLKDGEADDDEYAARFLLKSKAKPRRDVDADTGAPIVNLSYAAALAASMKMSEAAAEDTAVDESAETGDDDGWVSVSHQAKPKRNRNKGSFSKWR